MQENLQALPGPLGPIGLAVVNDRDGKLLAFVQP